MNRMLAFIKTMSTMIKDKFTSQQKQTILNTHSTSAVLVNVPNDDKYASIEINPDVVQNPASVELHCPVLTVAIGTLDILMLIAVYVVQEGTVLTSDTWIKMGCKYVPCMKPLDSKAEQELYNVGLKSQCQSFLFPYQFFRFFTPIFLHGGITHLLSNLIYQALAGSLLEKKYGEHVLGICYILFGFSGNIMSALCNPKNISVGASGAVYGLLFFCIIDNILQIFTSTDCYDKFIPLLVIPYFIFSIFFDVDFSGRTDHAAHIGGAVMGILVAIYLCKMPEFIRIRIPKAEKMIKLIAFILILSYFLVTLIIFYFFTPVNIK